MLLIENEDELAALFLQLYMFSNLTNNNPPTVSDRKADNMIIHMFAKLIDVFNIRDLIKWRRKIENTGQ